MKSNILKKITSLHLFFAFSVVVVYGFIRFKIAFLRPSSKGDENGFLSAFDFFKEYGYSAAVEKGTSILYQLTNRIINVFIDEPLMILRTSSLIYGILTFVVLIVITRDFFKLNHWWRYTSWITALNVMFISSILFLGINDTLLYLLIALIIYKFLNILNKQDFTIKDSIIVGVIIGAMFLTRMMSIIYTIPIGLTFLFLFYKLKLKSNQIIQNTLIVFTSFIFLIVVFNFPSLVENNKLSFHQKVLDEDVEWSQLQYLTALEHAKGNVKYGSHVSIEEVKNYIKVHGEDSLPKSFSSMAFFDLKFTFVEFIKDIGFQFKPIFRLTGLLILYLGLIIVLNMRGLKELFVDMSQQIIIPFTLVFIGILCFIIISYVEPRWYVGLLAFTPIAIFSLLQQFFEQKKSKDLLNFLFVNAQLLVIIVMNLPYILKNI